MKRLIPCLLVSFLAYACSPPGLQLRDSGLFNDAPVPASEVPRRKSILRTARKYLGVPYRYGGDDPRGFDCSGFVMYVYEANNISLPRATKAQFDRGKRISLGRVRPGDLLFFQTSRRRISHVGIYAGKGRFIHAPSSGKRISYASLENIYWKKRFRGAATYIRSRDTVLR
jgi:cell wall-associated NlpC family hydrolase